jgi:uncharacterized membrane protein YgcG
MKHGKICNELYREASLRFFTVIARFGHTLERASCDEVYVDLSVAVADLIVDQKSMHADRFDYSNACQGKTHQKRCFKFAEHSAEKGLKLSMAETHAIGTSQALLCAALLIAQIRQAVEKETGMTCSAGIGHSKLVSKVASGLHKPAQTTIVSGAAEATLLRTRPLNKVPLFGGKLGEALQEAVFVRNTRNRTDGTKRPVVVVGDVLNLPIDTLRQALQLHTTRSKGCQKDVSSRWVQSFLIGEDDRKVSATENNGEFPLTLSISESKVMSQSQLIRDEHGLLYWLRNLSASVTERVTADALRHNRWPKLFTLKYRLKGGTSSGSASNGSSGSASNGSGSGGGASNGNGSGGSASNGSGGSVSRSDGDVDRWHYPDSGRSVHDKEVSQALGGSLARPAMADSLQGCLVDIALGAFRGKQGAAPFCIDKLGIHAKFDPQRKAVGNFRLDKYWSCIGVTAAPSDATTYHTPATGAVATLQHQGLLTTSKRDLPKQNRRVKAKPQQTDPFVEFSHSQHVQHKRKRHPVPVLSSHVQRHTNQRPKQSKITAFADSALTGSNTPPMNEALDYLARMGFGREQAKAALVATGTGGLQAALEVLLSGK